MTQPAAREFSLFPLRIGIALVFIYSGSQKFRDLGGAADMFDSWGIPLAVVAAPLVAGAELFGGIGIMVGVLPRFSATVLSVVMATALVVVKLEGPFWNGWMVDAFLLGGLVTIVINGPGRPTIASVMGDARFDVEGRLLERLRSGSTDAVHGSR